MIYDVIIIGAGVSGCAIARELSRFQMNICVLEKGDDVCNETSKANSAIIHAGFDAETGSLKQKLNVRGNEMMDQVAKDLDIPFKRNGAMVVCTDESRMDGIRELYDRGVANGVKGLRILGRQECLAMEPNLSDQAAGALFAPTSGIICPFILTIAMAENACVNGVEFRFHTKAEAITREEDHWLIRTCNGDYKAKCIINAAGVYADVFHNMVSSSKIHITPRKGEYLLLDKSAGGHVSHTIFPQPTKMGKGVLVSPTVHGNLIIGPTAVDVEEKEWNFTTQEGLAAVQAKASENVKNLPLREVITSFAGLRAHEDGDDFIIGEVPGAPGFIDCAGIESPGLSSSPAIGEMVKEIVEDLYHPAEKEDWIGTRKGIQNPSHLSMEERNDLIRKNPAYGRIICRCESVSEGEILDAIHRPLGARTLDGIKRRVRAGMGRCQAGFCTPRVMEILNRELGIPMEEITKNGVKSTLVSERTKGVRE